MLKAEILCVGTELLLGDIVNTNAAFLARRWLRPEWRYTPGGGGDNDSRLREALSRRWNKTILWCSPEGLDLPMMT